MSIPLVVGDIVQLRIWVTQAEQAAVMTFNYDILGISGLSVSDADCARDFDSLVATPTKALLSTDASYRGVGATLIDRAQRPQTQYAITNQGPGGAAPPDLPRQTCGLISWLTAFSGRQYRGRTYWAFPATGMNATDGVPTPAYLTSLANIATAIQGITGFTNTGSTGNAAAQMIILHRQTKHPPLPVNTPVTGYIIRPKWATQRRRGSYGRANQSPI